MCKHARKRGKKEFSPDVDMEERNPYYKDDYLYECYADGWDMAKAKHEEKERLEEEQVKRFEEFSLGCPWLESYRVCKVTDEHCEYEYCGLIYAIENW